SLMDVHPLISRTGNLSLLGTRLHAQSVVSKFDGIDATEAAPEEVPLSLLFNVEGVDGVLYANLVAAKQFAAIGEGSLGAVGSCYANSAGPLTTPDRHGVIEYVGAVDIVDVRRPD